MNYQQMSFPAKKGLFETRSWFARLPGDVQDELMLAGRQRHLAAGCMLFRVGDEPTGLHGVLGGELHIIGSASNGDDKLMAIHRAGDWTGFLTCTDRQPHPLSAHAATDCQIFSVPPACVSRIFERNVATFRLLVDLGRWTHGERAGPVSPIEHVSQEELAVATNVSRQTMNSALNELEARGLIKIGYGRIDIIDSRGLDDLAVSDPEKIG